MKRYITLAIVSVAVILSSCSRELPSSVKKNSEMSFSIATAATRTAPIRTMDDFNREVTSMAGIIYVDFYDDKPICFMDDFQYSSELGGWHDVDHFLNWPTAQHFITVLMLAPGSEKKNVVFDPVNGMRYTTPTDFREMKDIHGAQTTNSPGGDFTLVMNPLLAPLQFNIADKPFNIDILSVEIGNLYGCGSFEPIYNEDGDLVDWFWTNYVGDKLSYKIENKDQDSITPLTNEFFAANNLFLIPQYTEEATIKLTVRDKITNEVSSSTISNFILDLNMWWFRQVNLYIDAAPRWYVELAGSETYVSCWQDLEPITGDFELFIE